MPSRGFQESRDFILLKIDTTLQLLKSGPTPLSLCSLSTFTLLSSPLRVLE